MKLQYQLNAAFTTLLVVIMAVTGYVIYSLILNMLIEDEQRQLKQKGEILVNILNEQYGTQNVGEVSAFLEEQDLQLFLYDRNKDRVLYSSMPKDIVRGFMWNNDLSDDSEELWEYRSDKYVTSRILVYPPETGLELILLTPLTDLQIVQQSFIMRLVVVFIIGSLVAIGLSYFMTNKLVTPLTRLRRQLKKIEQRQFDDIEPIKATGEIKEVEKSVYEMADALERYMNAQQAFFQNASHELKTPLMTIQGYAEGIRDQIFDAKEEEKGLEVMVSEVKRLKKIINEMILLAKLDSEQEIYEAEKVQISAVIDQVSARCVPLMNETGIAFYRDIQQDVPLVVDEEKFLRALLNLVFNGIRHAKTRVDLTVTNDAERMMITIEDDGEGIPEELIPHIFHRFVKGKSGETGLGLAIARAIIEQSGGKITVGDSKHGGAKFTLEFPIATANVHN
ncbi:MAG TPA: HAMP domain-containing sensor histidine kinase [Bacillota bacterium]|nr:HAMP domain-containing sensor histidine kinase [Bacillota bacterium]